MNNEIEVLDLNENKKKSPMLFIVIIIIIILATGIILIFNNKNKKSEINDTSNPNINNVPDKIQEKYNYGTYKCETQKTTNSIAEMIQSYTFEYQDEKISNGQKEIIVTYNDFNTYKTYDMISSFDSRVKPDKVINDDEIKTTTFIWYGTFTEHNESINDYIKYLNDMNYTCKNVNE